MSDSRARTNTRKKKRSNSFIVWIAFAVIACCFVVNLVGVYVNFREDRNEVAHIEAQVKAKKTENHQLQNTLDNFDMDSYVEKVAHDDLGYVFPDERVYYDQQLADK